MSSTWYPKLMRALGWTLLGLSVVVLLGGVTLAFSYADVYGWNGWSEAISQGWWILVVAAVPAIAGYLVLRIARASGGEASSGRRP